MSAPPQTCSFPVAWRCKVLSVGPPPGTTDSPAPTIPGLPNTTEFRWGGGVNVRSAGTAWSAVGNVGCGCDCDCDFNPALLWLCCGVLWLCCGVL